jgi:hypothetical protein
LIYLLSTQALLDILCGRDELADWQSSAAANAVELSVISIGQARGTITGISNPTRRRSFENALEGFLSAMKISDRLIPFEEGAAQLWATLTPMDLSYAERSGNKTTLSQPSRMVVATALARDAQLVEEPQPYHALVAGLRTYWP